MPFVATATGGTVNSLAVPGGWAIMEDTGITEANPETGPMATVKFKIYDGSQRYSFVNQLLGQWSGTPPNSYTYIGPYEYPPSTNLICTSVPSIESLGRKIPIVGVGLPWWFGEYAVVTAVFTRPPWVPLTDGNGFFTIEFNGSGQFLDLPGTSFQFPDGTPTGGQIGLLMPQAQIVVRRIRMPFLPDSIVTPLYGTVNNAPFEIGWNVYNKGTLLFVGMNTVTNAAPFGGITYDVSYLFNWRAVDWNYEWYPDLTTGWALVSNGAGVYRYGYTNFNVIP